MNGSFIRHLSSAYITAAHNTRLTPLPHWAHHTWIRLSCPSTGLSAHWTRTCFLFWFSANTRLCSGLIISGMTMPSPLKPVCPQAGAFGNCCFRPPYPPRSPEQTTTAPKFVEQNELCDNSCDAEESILEHGIQQQQKVMLEKHQ
jgi:hypothetical protein